MILAGSLQRNVVAIDNGIGLVRCFVPDVVDSANAVIECVKSTSSVPVIVKYTAGQ